MARNMMMGNVGFIGIGEGGCNIVNKFEHLGYKKVFYINSAIKDLNSLDTEDPTTTTFHIDNEVGCARDRDKAKGLVKRDYDIILSSVQKKMSNLKVIFVVFSMGGGTGSGMSPMLISGLTKRFPNTTFNTVSVIPDGLSSAKVKYNACECYNEIKKLKSILGNSYFINNNNICEKGKYTAKLETLDNSFVSRLNDVINVSDSQGSVDEAEVLSLLKTNGNVLLSEILPDITKEGQRLMLDISLTDVNTQVCMYHLYSVTDGRNYIKDEVENKYGIPQDDFVAYSDGADFVATFGVHFPDRLFEKIKEESEAIMSLRNEVEVEEKDLDMSSLSNMFKSTVSAKVKEKAIKNTNNILDDLEDF